MNFYQFRGNAKYSRSKECIRKTFGKNEKKGVHLTGKNDRLTVLFSGNFANQTVFRCQNRSFPLKK